MNLLDLLRAGRLKINTPNGNKPTTYQDTIPQMLNVRFPRNISPGGSFDQYVRFESSGIAHGVPDPVEITYYMVSENDEILTTENNDNLIIYQEIV
jgi:hypothetical protein